MRTATLNLKKPQASYKPARSQRCLRSCPLCKQSGRTDSHFLSECSFLPEDDRKFIAKARKIACILDEAPTDLEDEPQTSDPDPIEAQPSPSALRIQVRQSPYVMLFTIIIQCVLLLIAAPLGI